MGYWRELPGKIRAWRRWKKNFHPVVLASHKIPSETYIKYSPDYTFHDKKVLNLGCGTSVYKTPNVINLDAVDADGVNVVHDLSKMPLPFDDDSFDGIIANHVLEHIPNWWSLFQECARILKPGGTFEIWVPPVSSDSSFTYRDHINSIGILSFAGTASSRNPGCNLVVSEQNKVEKAAAQLELISHRQRPYMYWWLHFAPTFFLRWCTTHLRHTISEEGFIFRKNAHVG